MLCSTKQQTNKASMKFGNHTCIEREKGLCFSLFGSLRFVNGAPLTRNPLRTSWMMDGKSSWAFLIYCPLLGAEETFPCVDMLEFLLVKPRVALVGKSTSSGYPRCHHGGMIFVFKILV